MYWDLCKGISHGLKIYASKKRRLLQDQIQLGIGAKVQLEVVFWKGSGKSPYTCNFLIIV